jgi:hypothetical protein
MPWIMNQLGAELIANQYGPMGLGFETSFIRQQRKVSLRGRQAVLKTVMTGKPWGFDSSAFRQLLPWFNGWGGRIRTCE